MIPDIEDIVVREMSGLCGSCLHRDGCVYRMSTTKQVIQCEVYESTGAISADDNIPKKGLCLNCVKSQNCQLPKPASGVWHCEAYE